MPESKSARIRALNDQLRRTGHGGRTLVTSGILALAPRDQVEIFRKVRLYEAFDEASDPHHEHDFGVVEQAGETIFFKIGYYDPNCEYSSEDPADPARTTRVLTLLLSHEY